MIRNNNILTTVAEVPPGFQDTKPTLKPHGSPTEKSSCETCLERLPYMKDPRKLPCCHMYCYPCLKVETGKLGVVNCRVCGKIFDTLDIEKVTKVEKMKSSEDEEIPRRSNKYKQEVDDKPIPCDVCKKDPVDAVSFCVECGKKMCQKHVEFHDGYQNDFSTKKHKRISIEAYRVSPNRFEVCDKPGHARQQLIKACRNCYKLFCDRCDIRINCDMIGAKLHDVGDLEDLSYEFKEHLSDKMRSVSTKITDIIKLQKNTSGDLCDVEERVHDMIEEVEKVTAEQIAAINLKADQLKADINVHLQQSMSQVDMFSSSLMAKKDLLDELWTSTQSLLTQSRDAEVIRQYRNKKEQLDNSLEIELGFCHLSRRMLSNMSDSEYGIDLQLHEAAPSGLKFRIKEKSSTIHCSTVCWTEEGNFLCGRDSLMEVRHSDNVNVLKNQKTSNVNGVAIHKQGYLALHWSNGKNYIILYSSELTFIKLFGEFFRTTDKFSHLAASEKHVVAVDPDHKDLKVYSVNGDSLYQVKLVGMMRPWGAHFLPDGCILVTDFVGGSLRKYKLKAGHSEPLWICKDLDSPVGITTDFSGLIYVSSFTGKKIYVLSHEGLMLKVLSHKRLHAIKEVYDIDIVEDQIVLACGDEGLICFQLSFDAIVL